MDTSQILSIGSMVLSVSGIVMAVVNHKRIRSNCCGRVGQVSLDIENTTPDVSPPQLVLPQDSKASLDRTQSQQTK